MIDLSAVDGFEWDEGNKEKNWIQHKVAWTEAEEAFVGEPVMVLPDPKHSDREMRMTLLGRTTPGRKLTIIFTIRNNRVRVISAREMSKKERSIYDEAIEKNT